ncbi:MAG: NAD(+) synthase [Polyangiaceae bacterium]|nr:NAD(+) synthase [Polyangiaceae bacterium]
MKTLRVGAAALNQTPLDWDGNREHIRAVLRAARDRGVTILCLPELALCGYGCEDAFLSPAARRVAESVLVELLPETCGLVVNLGLPVFVRGAVYNASALACDGSLVGVVAKRALAGDGIHYEPRWFKPWPRGARSEVEVAGRRVPLGDLVFSCGGIRVGLEICEDAWVVERPAVDLARAAVDVILNPSASHFAFGKYQIRERLVVEGSRAFGVSYLYANLLGNEAGRTIYDGDTLIATAGELVARGRRFSFSDHELITAVVDVDVTRTRRAWITSYRPEVTTEREVAVELPAGTLTVATERTVTLHPAERGPAKEEEFARVIALGLFDYLRKSRARAFVVSMSGGADSSAVACLCALAVRFAVQELGVDGAQRRLAHVPAAASATDERGLVHALLVGAYQATRNSSDITRRAARGVAEALGARYYELDVDALVEGYRELIARAIGRPLEWATDDITLQNIQARARSPGIWMLANLEQGLLLTTSNRSEAALGYATMDGDTSGGVSPLAGIDKAFLREWLRWLEVCGPDGSRPIPELALVNAQSPTAELRPTGAGQTDEADLMPYLVLDAIERAAIRDKCWPREVLTQMVGQFPDYDRSELLAWVERFFTLFSRNQWKRERYAPSFHVDDANLDPKTWCRWPILSGGFVRELAELRAEESRTGLEVGAGRGAPSAKGG